MFKSERPYKLRPRTEFPLFEEEARFEGRVGMAAGIAGLMLIAVLVYLGSSSGTPSTYLNLPGIAVVIGGTLMSAFVQCSWRGLGETLSVIKGTRESTSADIMERVHLMLSFSRKSKDSGILALEDAAFGEPDRFLRLGLTAVVDGYEYEDIRKILFNEIEIGEAKTMQAIHTLESMASFAPAMGLIGTIIGLIDMLSMLQTPNAVGPAMAMALVSTLYGAVVANVFLFPLAGRLKNCLQKESMIKRITLEGLLSISRLENPQVLEQRMQSFSQAVSGD
jgi:chemotaxis protein MotA